jgi:GMP synthase (glutamine-hydrolysing)
VAAAVIGRAIGSQRLALLHIDNGLMRKDESAKVVELFNRLGLGQHLHFVNASDRFLQALEGEIDPERKRRIIGDTFIQTFQDEAARLDLHEHLLGQGTIYPDTIETGGTKRAETIKTHHNRVPIVEQLIARGKVVEPLADLYKVEVRELGEHLEIPDEALRRHPFPGPGLGVRLLCHDGTTDTKGIADIEPELRTAANSLDVDARLLPVRSVGVKADIRVYEHPVMLTGDHSWPVLLNAASTITANVSGVNRCVWNLGPAPTDIRPLAATVTRPRLDTLQEADHIVMTSLERHGIYDDVWQCPTVLVPLTLDGSLGELVVIRPVRSERAMTASPVRLSPLLLTELREGILSLEGVSGVAVDLTSKPPGTIEWE